MSDGPNSSVEPSMEPCIEPSVRPSVGPSVRLFVEPSDRAYDGPIGLRESRKLETGLRGIVGSDHLAKPYVKHAEACLEARRVDSEVDKAYCRLGEADEELLMAGKALEANVLRLAEARQRLSNAYEEPVEQEEEVTKSQERVAEAEREVVGAYKSLAYFDGKLAGALGVLADARKSNPLSYVPTPVRCSSAEPERK